jgi:hypothetical protein
MARKVRRVRRPVKDAPGTRKATSATRGRKTTVEDLREEYGYVVRDLRRVFLLAIAMFALLIALNLFFR